MWEPEIWAAAQLTTAAAEQRCSMPHVLQKVLALLEALQQQGLGLLLQLRGLQTTEPCQSKP